MKVFIEAYGCTLNHGEAAEFTDGLLRLGHELVSHENEADACVIFTCGVIETTERHMLRRIGQLAAEPERKLMVCSCLVDINPNAIMNVAPQALLIHTSEHMQGLRYFEGHEQNIPELPERNSAVGILPISTGCSGSCAYCITRKARGALRSRPPDEIRHRLERLVARNSVEIQICAQDTAIYGADIGMNLGSLVDTLETVEGNYMMRIGMMNPANTRRYLDHILRAYDSQKVFKFLHIPVQSGSDPVLERMNRGYTVEDFIEIVEMFRSRFPGLALSTDIIVGFPGETDDDFQASVNLIERIRPDLINITRFSSRPGTPADTMKNKVPGWTAKERSRRMTELRFKITGQNYEDMIGQNVRALATERHVEGTTFLRTGNYKPIVVKSAMELGEWYDVEITGARKVYLNGKLASEGSPPQT